MFLTQEFITPLISIYGVLMGTCCNQQLCANLWNDGTIRNVVTYLTGFAADPKNKQIEYLAHIHRHTHGTQESQLC